MHHSLQIGEDFAGEGAEAAHVNTVLGHRDGPVGVAWATALATPTTGHEPFVAVLRPSLPVKPLTLFVAKAAIAGPAHGELVWGAAQAGVAAGVADAVADGIVTAETAETHLLIAAVWVNPAAADPQLVYRNNRASVRAALDVGRRGGPPLDDVVAARQRPFNPYFRPEESR